MNNNLLQIIENITEVVLVPRLDNNKSIKIIKWHKQVGDYLQKGDVFATIESRTANVDIESFKKGVILYHGVKEGKSLAIDAVLLVLGLC